MEFADKIAEFVREKMLDPVFLARIQHQTSGRAFWVMETGAANYTRFVAEHPAYDDAVAAVYTTVELAMAACTANNGDIIFVDQEYTQTISAAAGITFDIAGVKVIGMGQGSLRPTLTFDTATTADVLVSAANCHLENFIFTSDINDLGMFLDLDEGNFTLKGCLLQTSSTKEALNFINIATTKDDFKFIDCEFLQPTDPEGTGAAANTGAIYCVDTENILIQGCRFRGFFETAIVHNKTTKVQNLIVKDCELSNSIAVPFVLVAASTGVCKDCYGATLAADDATEAKIFGTLGIAFWICNSQLGNDSGGGGQNGIGATACS